MSFLPEIRRSCQKPIFFVTNQYNNKKFWGIGGISRAFMVSGGLDHGTEMMKLKKNYEICLFTVMCIFINYGGKVLADSLALPVWLDSVGTVLSAYVFGPVCGAITGATVNILYSLHSGASPFYGLTNIAVGIVTGICARKGFLQNIFGMLSTAFLVAVFSTGISVTLNYILAGGSIGNVWGDGVAGLLQEMGIHTVFSHIVGEFYLDFLDKVITMLLLFGIVRIWRRRKEDRQDGQKE